MLYGKDIYSLTEKGLDLIPILIEMADWSAKHDQQTGAPPGWIALVNGNKEAMTRMIRETVQSGGSIFAGPNSVIGKLSSGP